MKTLLIALFIAAGSSARADFKQIKLEGRDAEKFSDIFAELGRSTPITNPVNGTVVSMFLDYSSEQNSFSISCANRSVIGRGVHQCTLNFEPLQSSSSVRISSDSPNEMTVILNDKVTVEKLMRRLSKLGFTSDAKAADGHTSRVRLSCSTEISNTFCQLHGAN